MPAATMTTMTNTAPIAVTQPKTDPAKIGMINNNRQGKHIEVFSTTKKVLESTICQLMPNDKIAVLRWREVT